MRPKTTLKDRLLHEVKKTALATLYFLVGFNLLALMLVLLAPGFREAAVLFTTATVAALLVGKVIVVSEVTFRRLVKGRSSFLYNVTLKSLVFTLIVVALLAAEEVVHGVASEGLGWGDSLAQLLENAAGGKRFLARFSYLMVLFAGYSFLFEIDRYFVGTTVGEIVASKYRRPRQALRTVMQIQLVEPIPYDQPDLRVELTNELYDVFSRRADEAGGTFQSYRGRGGIVLWDYPAPRTTCQELFDALSAYLIEHAEEHRARYGRAFELRAAAAQGRVLVMEVTSGDRREVISSGEAIERAEDLERVREEAGLVFDPDFPESAATREGESDDLQ